MTRKRVRMLIISPLLGAAGMMLFVGVPGAEAAGSCPAGGEWFEQGVPAGDIYDKNEDGIICTKLVDGDGNSANSQRGDGQNGFHADGHNHKDNNGPV